MTNLPPRLIGQRPSIILFRGADSGETRFVLTIYIYICEKSVGTTELHYSTKKRKHSFGILKAFFVRHSSEYETSDNDRKVNRNI